MEAQAEKGDGAVAPNHANRHVAKFLTLPDSSDSLQSSWVQIVEDGRTLTSERLRDNKDITLTKPILVKDKPESIGMKIQSLSKREVSIRDIADIIGHNHPVHVIDVEHQEELEGWTLEDLVNYFEDNERLMYRRQQEMAKSSQSDVSPTGRSSRRRRKAAQRCMNMTANKPRVLNQISLEFSKTALMERIASPSFVREIDWIDHAWPGFDQRDSQSVYPNVQYYCLTSAGGCYTDFHIDFGGTSVWYHILQGKKVFCLIPPTKKNLATYEEWLCRPDQAEVFLPDMMQNQEEVLRLTLHAGQTLIIPAAYIHAVYTPDDSLVLGGNFLHGMDIATQLQVHCIEARTKVQEKFRFPFFQTLHFYAGGMYLDRLRRGTVSEREVEGMGDLVHVLEEWWKVHALQTDMGTGPSVQGAAKHAMLSNQCGSVDEFLQNLREEYIRVKNHGISPTTKTPNTTTASTTKKPANDAKSTPVLRLKFALGKGRPTVSGGDGLSSQQAAIEAQADQPQHSDAMIHKHTSLGKHQRSDYDPPPKPKVRRLRISLSLGARKAHDPSQDAARPRPKKKREDTRWIVGEARDADDGEWLPGSGGKMKQPRDQSTIRSKSKHTRTGPGGNGDGGDGDGDDYIVSASVRKTKKCEAVARSNSISSRQRLMKRFRS